MYIFQFIYFRQQKNQVNTTLQQIFPDFLQDIAIVYLRYGNQGLRPVSYTSNQKIELVMNKWQYSVSNIKADKCKGGHKSLLKPKCST